MAYSIILNRVSLFDFRNHKMRNIRLVLFFWAFLSSSFVDQVGCFIYNYVISPSACYKRSPQHISRWFSCFCFLLPSCSNFSDNSKHQDVVNLEILQGSHILRRPIVERDDIEIYSRLKNEHNECGCPKSPTNMLFLCGFVSLLFVNRQVNFRNQCSSLITCF